MVSQLGQNLVPQGRPALTLLHYVVTQHLLLPAVKVGLTCETQDLRREGLKTEKMKQTRIKLISHNLI